MTEKPFSLSVKVVIRDPEGRCLLLKRSMDSKNNPGKWDLPGGKVDPGEGFHDALIREVAEETGLSIAIKRVAGTAESESPTFRIAYLIMEASTEHPDVRLSDEHTEFVWVSPSDLPKMDLVAQFLPLAEDFARRG